MGCGNMHEDGTLSLNNTMAEGNYQFRGSFIELKLLCMFTYMLGNIMLHIVTISREF